MRVAEDGREIEEAVFHGGSLPRRSSSLGHDARSPVPGGGGEAINVKENVKTI